ncbi:YeeE/YedE thiosulfate transporter family protein [Methanogenium cariaci]|uniref:YeeE/YedE thiosulfate transporter family protein n=1 Tax=Methanogenium cariaci TaxID=2197 RepID=UPI001FE0B36A|nr:YeeE/YedE thiosulfate transporter family protein [Methanogenium cariaci]
MDWTPYIAGVGIGVLSWVAFLLSNKPLGCSTAYTRTSGMIERIFRGKKTDEKPYYQTFAPLVDWEWMLVAGVVLGAFVASVMLGGFSFEWVPTLFGDTFGYDTGLRLAVALVGGILMGLGSRWAGGGARAATGSAVPSACDIRLDCRCRLFCVGYCDSVPSLRGGAVVRRK